MLQKLHPATPRSFPFTLPASFRNEASRQKDSCESPSSGQEHSLDNYLLPGTNNFSPQGCPKKKCWCKQNAWQPLTYVNSLHAQKSTNPMFEFGLFSITPPNIWTPWSRGGRGSWQGARQLLFTRGSNSLSCGEGRDGAGARVGACLLGGNDGLAKAGSERTKERGPINILSWLPERLTAVEMLR